MPLNERTYVKFRSNYARMSNSFHSTDLFKISRNTFVFRKNEEVLKVFFAISVFLTLLPGVQYLLIVMLKALCFFCLSVLALSKSTVVPIAIRAGIQLE